MPKNPSMPSNDQPVGRAQFRADMSVEQESVRTTIVGGRPPGSGKPVGPVPRGLEVLIKKATVDFEFRRLLLEDREAAAAAIGLNLDPVERAMLGQIPASQLETVIAQTTVPDSQRRAFLGQAAAVMLGVLAGTALTGCGDSLSKGNRPPTPSAGILPHTTEPEGELDIPVISFGIQPDEIE